jgi:hypothetical protein
VGSRGSDTGQYRGPILGNTGVGFWSTPGSDSGQGGVGFWASY